MADEKGSWGERWQYRQEMQAHGIQVGWRLPTREDFAHFNDARNLKDSMDTWLPNEVQRISLLQIMQSIDYVTPDEQSRIHDLTMKEDRTQPERLELIALWSKVAPVAEVVREEVQALEDHAAMQEDEGQVFGSTFEEDRWRMGREDMPPVAFIKSMVQDAITTGELTEAQRTAVESRMAADYLRDAPEAYRGALTLLARQDDQTLDLFQPHQLAFDDRPAAITFARQVSVMADDQERPPYTTTFSSQEDATAFRQAVDRMAEQTKPHAWIAAEAARLRVDQGSADVVKDVAKKDHGIGW